MVILVTGAHGQLGHEVLTQLKGTEHEVFHFSKDGLDISNLSDVISVFNGTKPDVVINCAAYTNVDGCESNKDEAFKVNALGAKNLAMICEQVGAKLIHISTDYVYNSEHTEPIREYELTEPESVYGKTKLMGDEYVRDFCSKYFIIRTSWLYGMKGKNFVYTILKNAKEKGKLKVVNDQIGSPTNCKDLVSHVLKLMSTEEYGIYHCTAKGECSWYDFACKIVELSGIPCEVSSCATGEFKTVAKRPAYSYLDNMMLRCTIGDNMRPWEEALEEFIKILKERHEI